MTVKHKELWRSKRNELGVLVVGMRFFGHDQMKLSVSTVDKVIIQSEEARIYVLGIGMPFYDTSSSSLCNGLGFQIPRDCPTTKTCLQHYSNRTYLDSR